MLLRPRRLLRQRFAGVVSRSRAPEGRQRKPGPDPGRAPRVDRQCRGGLCRPPRGPVGRYAAQTHLPGAKGCRCWFARPGFPRRARQTPAAPDRQVSSLFRSVISGPRLAAISVDFLPGPLLLSTKSNCAIRFLRALTAVNAQLGIARTQARGKRLGGHSGSLDRSR